MVNRMKEKAIQGLALGTILAMVFVVFAGIPMNMGADGDRSIGSAGQGNTLITTEYGIIEVDNSGNVVWQMTGVSYPRDAERLANGNTLIADMYNHRVIEVNSAGSIVWQMTGLNIPVDVERLTNGNTLIVEKDKWRVIEVDSACNIIWQKTGVYCWDAERLANDNTLLMDYYHHRVIEVDSSGNIVWSYSTKGRYATDVERFANGNTLITGWYNAIEIDPTGTIVWQKTTICGFFDGERLTNGNTLITNSADGRVIEVDSLGNIVWEVTGLYNPHDAERLVPSITEVAIDIKPGSDPNSINLNSKGNVPVAVLTTDDFDASDVDPNTVVFAGVEPVKWTMEDVDDDGDDDMLFHFKTQDLDLDEDSTEATLFGKTKDWDFFEGTDTVNIVPMAKGKK